MWELCSRQVSANTFHCARVGSPRAAASDQLSISSNISRSSAKASARSASSLAKSMLIGGPRAAKKGCARDVKWSVVGRGAAHLGCCGWPNFRKPTTTHTRAQETSESCNRSYQRETRVVARRRAATAAAVPCRCSPSRTGVAWPGGGAHPPPQLRYTRVTHTLRPSTRFHMRATRAATHGHGTTPTRAHPGHAIRLDGYRYLSAAVAPSTP